MKSNIHVTVDGNILRDISDKMEVLCPTCHGKGTIPDPQYLGQVLFYIGTNGESVPLCSCRTCYGSGWVITNPKY